MLDIKFLRENPDAVKENIKKKFQDHKLPLVDQVISLDAQRRDIIQETEAIKAANNKLSKANGPLFGKLKKCADDAERAEIEKVIEENKEKVRINDEREKALDTDLAELDRKIREIMYVIPNIIDPSVPVGKDDSQNVEIEKFGEPAVPDFEIPYHTEIMKSRA